MGKRQRTDAPGAVHHLTARVNWQVFHLSNPRAIAVFLNAVRTALERFHVSLLAMVLMSNHHHMVVRSPTDKRFRELTSRKTRCRHTRPYPPGHPKASVLAQFAAKIHRTVAVVLLRELSLSGRFWERRYDARLIRTPRDLRSRIAYDHRNPVRASIVLRPEHFPLSTANAYATDLEAGPVPLADERDLPFDLGWEELRRHVIAYQASKELDDLDEALKKRGVRHGSPEYEQALIEFLREAKLE